MVKGKMMKWKHREEKELMKNKNKYEQKIPHILKFEINFDGDSDDDDEDDNMTMMMII